MVLVFVFFIFRLLNFYYKIHKYFYYKYTYFKDICNEENGQLGDSNQLADAGFTDHWTSNDTPIGEKYAFCVFNDFTKNEENPIGKSDDMRFSKRQIKKYTSLNPGLWEKIIPKLDYYNLF